MTFNWGPWERARKLWFSFYSSVPATNEPTTFRSRPIIPFRKSENNSRAAPIAINKAILLQPHFACVLLKLEFLERSCKRYSCNMSTESEEECYIPDHMARLEKNGPASRSPDASLTTFTEGGSRKKGMFSSSSKPL